MKYRGVELKVGNEFESELCIGVEYSPMINSYQKIIDLVYSKINNVITNKCYFEDVLSNYILLRNHLKFTLDEDGIKNLKEVYDLLQDIPEIDVYIDIHTDDWFEIDGEEFNGDSVDWNNFIENLGK